MSSTTRASRSALAHKEEHLAARSFSAAKTRV
jgi:hypothetical protein